jgi:hypothetical protein
LHYVYPNQSELIEELDVNSNEVLGKDFIFNSSLK